MIMQTLTNVKMIFRTSRKRRIILTKNLCLDYLSLLFRGNGGGTYFFQLFVCCIMDNSFNINELRSFAKERSEKFRSERDSNADLCDASAVLHQLSYQANWELVIICVTDKPIDSG